MANHLSFYCGVQCIVFRQGAHRMKDQVLLGRRIRTAGEGQWALPGGHVEPNESPIATARRELLEETGLIGESATLGATFFTYTTEVPYAHVPVIFDDVQGEPTLISDERFSDLRFFRLDRLPDPLFEPSKIAIGGIKGGATFTSFEEGPGVSFLKVDMALLEPCENRNSSYTVTFLRDQQAVTLEAFWGRREFRSRFAQRFTFTDLDEGIQKLEEIVRKRIRRHYYVTGVIGDVTIDRIMKILPEADSLRVVSNSLLRRLLRDDDFRKTYAKDFYLYHAETSSPLDQQQNYQQPLFEL